MGKYRVWEKEELAALKVGVQRHGAGNWELIRTDPELSILLGRSGVQIKDKWRNLVKFKHVSSEEIEACKRPRVRTVKRSATFNNGGGVGSSGTASSGFQQRSPASLSASAASGLAGCCTGTGTGTGSTGATRPASSGPSPFGPPLGASALVDCPLPMTGGGWSTARGTRRPVRSSRTLPDLSTLSRGYGGGAVSSSPGGAAAPDGYTISPVPVTTGVGHAQQQQQPPLMDFDAALAMVGSNHAPPASNFNVQVDMMKATGAPYYTPMHSDGWRRASEQQQQRRDSPDLATSRQGSAGNSASSGAEPSGLSGTADSNPAWRNFHDGFGGHPGGNLRQGPSGGGGYVDSPHWSRPLEQQQNTALFPGPQQQQRHYSNMHSQYAGQQQPQQHMHSHFGTQQPLECGYGEQQQGGYGGRHQEVQHRQQGGYGERQQGDQRQQQGGYGEGQQQQQQQGFQMWQAPRDQLQFSSQFGGRSGMESFRPQQSGISTMGGISLLGEELRTIPSLDGEQDDLPDLSHAAMYGMPPDSQQLEQQRRHRMQGQVGGGGMYFDGGGMLNSFQSQSTWQGGGAQSRDGYLPSGFNLPH